MSLLKFPPRPECRLRAREERLPGTQLALLLLVSARLRACCCRCAAWSKIDNAACQGRAQGEIGRSAFHQFHPLELSPPAITILPLYSRV